MTVKKGAPASELLAKLPGVVVTAMEELPDGDLVVATLPGGELHRVTRRGKVSSFATLDGTAEFDPANPPFDAAKTAEWIQYAEGFTSGSLAGDEARAAFAKATWGNYDKSAPLNRFGLCAFGETGGTKALGVNCDGY